MNVSSEKFKFTEENIEKMFGKEAAEDEHLDNLKSYYVKSKTHEQITSSSKLKILVGHKGIGKSAVFTVARAEDIEKNKISLLIKPDDIDNLAQKNNFSDMIKSWKDGLTKLIQDKILEDYFEFDDKSKYGTVGPSIFKWLDKIFSEKQGEASGKLSEIISKFNKDKEIYIYIDDLDRGWKSNEQDISRISALLNAVRDLSNNDMSLKFRISLRTDVYYLVRTSDESTDKIESSVVWHKWDNHHILIMLIRRLLAFSGQNIDLNKIETLEQDKLAKYLNPYFEERFMGIGKWNNAPIYRILMSLIRKRPRDMVKLCILGARDAFDKDDSSIGTKNWESIFDQYSQDRLQDTINEYKSELPEIKKLLLEMKPSSSKKIRDKKYLFTSTELKEKLKNILSNNKFKFSNNKSATIDDLIFFLYKINFLTARRTDETGKIHRVYFEEKRYITPDSNIDFGYDYEIHPAYRWALSTSTDNISVQDELIELE